jgi:hypothetical protein
MRRIIVLSALALASAQLAAAEPNAKAMEHGRRQVERMLRDRPEMTRYPSERGYLNLAATDPQLQWAVRKFAGEDTGFLIYWEPKPPMDVNEAEHASRDATGRAVIRVAKVGFPVSVTKENAFETMWSGAVFELLNITRHERFEELHTLAWKKKIDRDGYISGMAKVEYEALRQLQAYATSVWRPWAASAGARMDDSQWWIDLPATFDEWIGLYRDKNAYPWHPYGLHYDEVTGAGR